MLIKHFWATLQSILTFFSSTSNSWNFLSFHFSSQKSWLTKKLERFEPEKIGNIDVGDRCWIRNVLRTTCRFFTLKKSLILCFRHQRCNQHHRSRNVQVVISNFNQRLGSRDDHRCYVGPRSSGTNGWSLYAVKMLIKFFKLSKMLLS